MIWQLAHILTIIAPKLKEIRSSETADETEHSFSINEPALLLIRYVSHGYQMPREQSLGRLSESDRRPNDCSLGI